MEKQEIMKNKISGTSKDKNLKKERVSIFIDGSNLYNNLKKLGSFKEYFHRMISFLVKERILVSVSYYVAPLNKPFNEVRYWKHEKFLNMLRKNSKYKVVLCKLRKIKQKDGSFRFEVKGDDVNLAIDLVSGAFEDSYDVAIIVSGDEDFVPAISKVKILGKKVENAYFLRSSSNALKHSSDKSTCLNDFFKKLNLPSIAHENHAGEINNKDKDK